MDVLPPSPVAATPVTEEKPSTQGTHPTNSQPLPSDPQPSPAQAQTDAQVVHKSAPTASKLPSSQPRTSGPTGLIIGAIGVFIVLATVAVMAYIRG